MENNNTSQQAFYTKMPDASQNLSGDTRFSPVNPGRNQVGKSNSKRNIFAVAGLVFFIIVALTGVFIAQKQVSRDGEVKPVAPNAPESQPQASTDENNQCVTTFFVPKGEAKCENKVALTDFSKNGGEEIEKDTNFDVGDSFVFKIVVSASDDTTGSVEVIDILPNDLEFVVDADNTQGLIVERPHLVDNQTISIDLGEMKKDDQEDIEFRVKVIEGLGRSTNSAKIVTNADETTASSCSFRYTSVEGTIECISKELYDTNPENSTSKLVTQGSALNRGEKYIYYINLKARNKVIDDIYVSDKIPESLEFVAPLSTSEDYLTYDPIERVVTANLGKLENEEIQLGFIVKVVDKPAIGVVTNYAQIYKIIGSQKIYFDDLDRNCQVSHTIVPIGTAQCVEKQAFTDFNGELIAANAEVKAGQEFVYKINIQAEDITVGNVIVVDNLSEELEYIVDPENTPGLVWDEATRKLAVDLKVIDDSDIKTVQFKVKVIANPLGDVINNTATITTNIDTSHTCTLPLRVFKEKITYACNKTCQTDANCQTVNYNYICYGNEGDKVCRLSSNLTSTTCSAPTPTPTPTATPTPTPTATPTPTPTATPTPAPGCNDLCTSNADCSNASHVCMTISDGSNRCRLESYPDSVTCTAPVVIAEEPTTQQIAQQPTQQPELPVVLPETGPADWLNWLKAGLVTLGIGTALFLLL